MDGVSIIVCCYNSANRIEKTLEYLFALNFNEIQHEILIIDNNCIDNTVEVVENFHNKIDITVPLRIIKQPIAGLAFAREKGVSNANYEYIVFCDDDNWLSPNYILNAVEIMNVDQSIGVLGGRGEAVSHVTFPFWFSSYQDSYVVGVQAIKSGDITDRGFVWGAGMVLRKSVYLNLINIGFSPILSDRKGNILSSGGDSEICSWFIFTGYKLWYDENLTFKHFIPEDRLTKEYCIKLFEGFKKANEKLEFYRALINYINDKPLNKVVKFIYYTIRSILNRNQLNDSRVEGYNFLPFPLFSKIMFDSKRILIKLKKSI